MITFIILRLLDIWSTLLSVSTFGDDDLDTSTDNRSLSGLKKLFNYMKR